MMSSLEADDRGQSHSFTETVTDLSRVRTDNAISSMRTLR
jgi:hypothetical protein